MRVTITSRAILVGGEQVAAVSNGEVSAEFVEGEILVVPLVEALKERVDRANVAAAREPEAKFEPTATIVVGPATPYRIVLQAMYAIGQTGAFDKVDVRDREENLTVIPLRPQNLEALAANLTVVVQDDGITLSAAGRVLEPIEGCPGPRPTVCNIDPTRAAMSFAQARLLTDEGKLDAAQDAVEAGFHAYRWYAAYNRIVAFVMEHPEVTDVNIAADSQVPWEVVARTVEMVRHYREAPTYDSNTALWHGERTREMLDLTGVSFFMAVSALDEIEGRSLPGKPRDSAVAE